MKKILILTLSPFSETDNMGSTLLNLFKKYDSKKINQLYIGNLKPEIYFFNSCYCISDYDVINYLIKNKKYGKIINSQSKKNNTEEKNCIYKNIKKKGLNFSSFMIYARNIVWMYFNINKSNLEKWIKDFKPEVMFFVLNRYTFTYNICINILKKFNIPLIIYVADDYYIYYRNNPLSIFSKYQIFLRKKINKIMKHANGFIGIGNEMTRNYISIFNVPGYTIYTPYSEIYDVKIKKMDNKKINFVFLGNLEFLRHLSIIELSNCLLNIEKELNFKIILEIYTLTKEEKILKLLKKQSNIVLHSPISKKEVIKVLRNADFAIHVESFEKKEIKKTALSISTKIPDMLANANSIIAYGPEVASIKYLESISKDIVAKNKIQLKEKITKLLKNESQREELYKTFRKIAKINHSQVNINNIIEQILKKS